MKIKLLRNCLWLIAVLLAHHLGAQTCANLEALNDCNVQINAVGGIDGPIEFCEGQQIRFVNNSTGPIDGTIYCWGDGTSTQVAGTAEGIHTYIFNDTCLPPLRNGLRSLNVSMIVFKTCAGGGVSSHFVTTPARVRVKPLALFSARDTACAETDITFTNRSCGNDSTNRVTYLWDFGDGTTSTTSAATLTHRYADLGDYTVRLTVTNRCGARTATQVVHVVTKPARADLRVTAGTFTVVEPYVVCLRDSGIVHLDGSLSQYATSFRWSVSPNFGYTWLPAPPSLLDTNTRVRLRFTQAGNYTVTLTTNNRCGVVATKTVTFKVIANTVLRLNPQNDTCHAFTYRPNPVIAGAIYTFDGTPLNPAIGRLVTIGQHTVRATFDDDCGHQEQTFQFSLSDFTAAAMVSPRLDTTVCFGGGLIPLITNQLNGGNWSSTNGQARFLARNDTTFWDPQFVGTFPITYARGTAGCRTTTGLTISVVTAPTVDLPTADTVCVNGSSNPRMTTFNNGGNVTTVNWTFATGSPTTFSGQTPTAVTWNTIGTHQMTVTANNICGMRSDTTLITVLPNTQVAVTPTVTGSCAPVMADFDNTTLNASSYNWGILRNGNPAVAGTDFRFENSTSNTSKPLKISLLKQGNYIISLQAGGRCQPNSWTSQTIVVKDTPHIRLAVPANSCVGTNFLLNAIIQQPLYSNGNDNTTTLIWTTTGASTATSSGLNPPAINWNAAGTYSIMAKIMNSCGSDSMTVPVQVLPRGVASATVTGIRADSCGPFDIIVNNTSSNAAGYNWVIRDSMTHLVAIQNTDFQYINATNATSASPQIRFLKGGLYRIGLGIANACEGANWDTTIFVRTKPTVTIGQDTTFCINNAYQPRLRSVYKGNDSTQIQWLFPFGNPNTHTGNAPPTVRYDTAGTFTVLAIAWNYCGADTARQVLTVQPRVGTNVSVTGISADSCGPFTVVVNNRSTGAFSQTWEIWDSLNRRLATQNIDYQYVSGTIATTASPSIRFLKGGKYQIRLKINNPCGNSNWDTTFFMRTKPALTIGRDTTFCVNNSYQPRILTFSNGNDSTQIKWIFPGGTPAVYAGNNPPLIRYDVDGIYGVICIAKNTCGSDTAKQILTILPSARPDVSISGIPANQCVTLPFTLTINNISANVNGFRWTLQDENGNSVDRTKYNWVGNDSSIREPILMILKNGRYRLRLTLNNACQGATWDTLFQIYSKPDITVNSITLAGVCSPQSIGFQGVLADDGGLAVRYRWRPTGDTTLVVASRRFDTSGVVRFVLTATNLCGTDADSTSVTIQSRPIVRIQHQIRDTICNSSPAVQLTASPLGGAWSGTGVSSTGIFDPSVLSNATYPIVYQYGTGDCIERDTYRLTVFGTPVNAGAAVALCDTASPAFTLLGATPLNGRWSGTGITDPILGRFTPSVSGAGVHFVIYTYIDSRTGCSNQAFKQVTIFNRPKAVIDSIPPGCRDIEVQLTGVNSLLSTSYQWQLGDGDTANIISPRPIYRAATTYTIQLIVTSRNGCKDTTSRTVRIAAPPTALPVPKDTIVCHQSTIPFRTTGFAQNFLWTYPDGSATNFPVPQQTYRFNNTGLNDTIWRVRLAVTNTGCPTKTDTIKITVQPQIKAVITADKSEICNNDSIRFANPSRGHVRSWYWDLGNGMISRDSIPFRNVGIRYQTIDTVRIVRVQLIVEGECGRDTTYYPIRVLPITTRAFFNMDRNTGCPPLTVRFENASSSFAGITYNFGDNTPNSSQPIVNHTFTNAGTYKIILYAFNNCGGFDTISQIVTVKAAPPIDSIVYKLADHCRTTDVKFQAYTHGLLITGHLWRFDNGDSSRSAQPMISFQNGGIHRAYLTLFSGANNCPSMDSIQFPLLQPVDLGVSSVLSDSCGTADGVIVLNPRGGAIPYRFSLDDTLHWNPSPIFPHLQGRQYHIGYVKDARGCTDTVAIYVPGVAPLNVNAGGNVTLKLGDSTFVRAIMNFNAVSVQWKSANPTWIRTPTKAGTWIMPLRTQVYGVFGRTANGCTASDSIKIQVVPVKFIDCPSAFSPNNDGENDYLRPQCSKDVIKIRVFRVYNRWGTLVYERLNFDPHDTMSSNGGWDGTYGGVEQPIDVYTWYCEADFLDETSTATPAKGSTSLIR
jgi:gliding motility-associated-like protein